jgi:hypothetical protein
MRALAEFVMRGRTQAIGVAALAVASQLLALIGVAVVALVALRRGARDGLIVMVWAMLPAVVFAALFADFSGVLALAGATLAALLLRSSRSWPLALLVAVGTGLLAAVLFSTVASAYVEQWIASAEQVLRELQQQNPQAAAQLPSMRAPMVSGALGWGACGYVVLSLLIARWWQSVLYNPGGFRSEFHALRLPPAMAVGLMAAVIGIGSVGGDYAFWALMFTVPLGIAGLALVHGAVAKAGLGKGVLVGVYLALLFIAWAKFILLLLALADSFVNFRARIKPRASD